ncbi:MAG TPA: hypothetical protein VD793_06210, partial [Gemmatimonadales bacterium]|nr:hypothetical protein [Gemmatimonadales bacterium]
RNRSAVAGYSASPLVQKLGIKPGNKVRVVGAPPGYRRLLAPLPQGVTFVTRLSTATDMIHLFATSKAQLRNGLAGARRRMRANAMVWVSWPKRTAGVATDITEDVIREVALPLGLVDVKVCAVTDVWSGLKLVIRKELR